MHGIAATVEESFDTLHARCRRAYYPILACLNRLRRVEHGALGYGFLDQLLLEGSVELADTSRFLRAIGIDKGHEFIQRQGFTKLLCRIGGGTLDQIEQFGCRTHHGILARADTGIETLDGAGSSS